MKCTNISNNNIQLVLAIVHLFREKLTVGAIVQCDFPTEKVILEIAFNLTLTIVSGKIAKAVVSGVATKQ